MQFLYNLELNHQDTDEALQAFWEMNPADDSCREFAEIIAKGTIEHKQKIDAVIDKYAINWDIERIALLIGTSFV